MHEIIVGIDLGTTNSAMAIYHDGHIQYIKDLDQNMLPSYVGLNENQEIVVGELARQQYPLSPLHTIKSIKRKMGHDVNVTIGDQQYTPQEISAMILRRLKYIAEQCLEEPIKKAVITVPAFFSDAQRHATKEAGDIAGLEVVRIINEPTAAALAYESSHRSSRTILVYDLGGGTFDVSVVSIEDDVVEVLASHGNNLLGGDDFDQKLSDHMVEFIQEQHKINVTKLLDVMAQINHISEQVKIKLSDQPFVQISETLLSQDGSNAIELALEISREQYEAMINPYLDQTIEAIQTALHGANLDVADLDDVLLVGGATRTPLVADRIFHFTHIQARTDIDVDLCVAAGAAVQGAMIAGQQVQSVLVDITPYTFGTAVLGEMDGAPYEYSFAPIIHKNTPIPVAKSEVFYTAVDHQSAVVVSIYQGEQQDALYNIKLGEFRVEGLSDVACGNPIIMELSLDLDGMLHVTATEKNTGLAKSISIEGALAQMDRVQIESSKSRLNAVMRIPDVEQDVSQVDQDLAKPRTQVQIIQAQAMIEKAERMLDAVSDDDREEIIDLIEEIRDLITDKEIDELADPVGQLADIMFYIDV